MLILFRRELEKMKTINKKVIFGSFFLIIVCICFGVICFGKTERFLYEKPDKILIYKDGNVIEVKDTDLYFQKLLEREKVLEARINLLPYYARKVVKPVIGICSRDLVRFVKVCELCGLEIDYVH